jgi:acetyl esterase/lipase
MGRVVANDLRLGFARRALLMAAGGLGLGAASAATATPAPLTRPLLPKTLPEAWITAPSIPLWTPQAPGQTGFKPQTPPPTWPDVFERNIEAPSLRLFRPARPNGAAVLIMPGGGYAFVSISNEGVDIAARLTALGYTAFVLSYRLPGEGWPHREDAPLQDAQRAMRLIRSRAAAWGLDPQRIAVLGFSAGGHLAASLATGFSETVYSPTDAADALDARPSAAGLIYPLITMTQPDTHGGARSALLGDAPSPALIAKRSDEQHVDSATPPIFLAQAIDDGTVPVDNSLMMMAACRAAKRPVEAHFFQEGGHAFGVGYAQSPSALWIDLFHLWLGRNGVA